MSVTEALQREEAGASSDAAAALIAMDLLHGTEEITLERTVSGKTEHASVLVVPQGMSVVSIKRYLDEYMTKPERRKGTATLTDAASFIALANRFKSDASAVFANPDRARPAFVVVFDYHGTGGDVTTADFLQHRAVYAPALSDPWKAWTGQNGKAMAQADFAAFIEEHATDLIVPELDDPDLRTFAALVQGKFAEPSDLVALSRGLELNVGVAVKNVVTLGTGEISVVYEESHRDGQGNPISIPNLFQVCIPVFYAGDLYKIAVRLRYKVVGDGKLQWSYHLVRTDLVFDDAFRGIAEKVREETTAPVFLGSPES